MFHQVVYNTTLAFTFCSSRASRLARGEWSGPSQAFPGQVHSRAHGYGFIDRSTAELTCFQNLGQQGRVFHTTVSCEGLIDSLLREVPWISAFMCLTAYMTEDVLKSWMELTLFYRGTTWLEMKINDSRLCLLIKWKH